MVGGYAMIDMSGIDLTGSDQNNLQIYNQLKASENNKPVILYNLQSDGELLTPAAAITSVDNAESFVLAITGYTITVTYEGDVTIEQTGGGSVDPSDVYTILDVNGLPIDEALNEGTEGWYTTLSGADTSKPIFLTNFVFSSSIITSYVNVFIRKTSTTVIVYAPTGTLFVKNDNTTTFDTYF